MNGEIDNLEVINDDIDETQRIELNDEESHFKSSNGRLSSTSEEENYSSYLLAEESAGRDVSDGFFKMNGEIHNLVVNNDDIDENQKIMLNDEESHFKSSIGSFSPTWEDENSPSPLAEEPAGRDVPDGGWGWVIVFAAFVINLISDGVLLTFGVIYVQLLKHFRESKGKTAWIGGLFMAVPLIAGPIASTACERWGCRRVCITGAILSSIGFIITSFAPSINCLIFTVGIVTGVGIALCYLTSLVVVAYYFDKRLSLATGISVCGSGLGTVIFAPLTSWLCTEYGWRGTTLILSAVMLHMCACGIVMRDLPEQKQRRRQKRLCKNEKKVMVEDPKLDKRLPQGISRVHRRASHSLIMLPTTENIKNKKKFSLYDHILNGWREFLDIVHDLVDFSYFLDLQFLVFAASNFVLFSWYHVPYVFLADKAITMGFDETQASWLISILGLLNTIGEVFIGWLGDQPWVDVRLIYIISMFACGFFVGAVPWISSYEGLAILAGGFGLSVAANYTLIAVLLVELLPIENFARAYGLLLLVQGMANLIGPPLAGWLYDMTLSYDLSFYFAGIFIIISGLLLVIVPRDRKRLKCWPHSQNSTSEMTPKNLVTQSLFNQKN